MFMHMPFKQLSSFNVAIIGVHAAGQSNIYVNFEIVRPFNSSISTSKVQAKRYSIID